LRCGDDDLGSSRLPDQEFRALLALLATRGADPLQIQANAETLVGCQRLGPRNSACSVLCHALLRVEVETRIAAVVRQPQRFGKQRGLLKGVRSLRQQGVEPIESACHVWSCASPAAMLHWPMFRYSALSVWRGKQNSAA
jgi:hypothetical protein